MPFAPVPIAPATMPAMNRLLSPRQLDGLAFLAGLVVAALSPHFG
jgi:hypothetical protein